MGLALTYGFASTPFGLLLCVVLAARDCRACLCRCGCAGGRRCQADNAVKAKICGAAMRRSADMKARFPAARFHEDDTTAQSMAHALFGPRETTPTPIKLMRYRNEFSGARVGGAVEAARWPHDELHSDCRTGLHRARDTRRGVRGRAQSGFADHSLPPRVAFGRRAWRLSLGPFAQARFACMGTRA